MRRKKKGFDDALLLIAIIATALGLLGGLSLANLPYVNFSSTIKIDDSSWEEGNVSKFNLLGADFMKQAFGEKDGAEKEVSLENAVEFILAGWVMITALLAIISLTVGAFLYITAHGNDDQLNKAKQQITLTILGLVLASLAYLIVKVVVSIFY